MNSPPCATKVTTPPVSFWVLFSVSCGPKRPDTRHYRQFQTDPTLYWNFVHFCLDGIQCQPNIQLVGSCETSCRCASYKKATAQQAHLVFADIPITIGTNAEEPIEPVFASAD